MTLSLDDIVKLTGGRLLTPVPPETTLLISGVATLAEAAAQEAAFLGNEKYFKDFMATRAGVVLVPPSLPEKPEGPALIEVENPSLAFNALVDAFMKVANDFEPGIDPSAVVHPTAKLDPTKVRVQAGAIIEASAEIGDGSDIGPGCVVGKAAKLGQHCKLYARVVVRERCILGNHVVVQPGAVIGSDGFGFLLNKETGRYETVDQVGIVVIEDHVDIGANTAIDRARFGRTVIGEGSKIDNLVQIGHNVTIGKHTVIVSQSGIAGSTHVGDYVTIAAQCGIAGHLNVGDKVVMAARTGVMGNLEGGQAYWGSPSAPFAEARMQMIAVRRLPEAIKELKAMKKQAEQLRELLTKKKPWYRFW
ncbi:MAG: UDP-3-O-(3-hydroxymyristoyl)glucosamine N-acyltransferase [Akkermansiaceae bacterium]|nr:UDP-3-O-(3-hydroxymyristoyl)glucosamine N-acyltransferase [Akkermansiaceae bacterium]